MSESGKWIAWLVSLIIAILIVWFIVFSIGYANNKFETKECTSYIENNPDKDFKVVGGECSVLFHDLWVEVEKFEYSLP
jgi:hypothetical protein